MTARIAIISFPGSNCEYDVAEALGALGAECTIVFHDATELGGVDGVVIPGGFAHGDYLRCGAIARFSPIMSAVTDFANAGGAVLGICNGFQVLTEAGLLPGALQRNAGLRFLCEPAVLEVASSNSNLTAKCARGDRVVLPINHGEGNYYCDAATLAELEENDQVVLRYLHNPNGSVSNIAGVSNRRGNVVGLMPHPERAAAALAASTDGRVLLDSFLSWALTNAASPTMIGA